MRKTNLWTLDHSHDEYLRNWEAGIPVHGIQHIAQETCTVEETKEEEKARQRSHYVVYFTMVNISIGFSIVLSGIFPYLKLLEKNDHLSKTYLGWAISANPMGLLVSAPLTGILINKLGSVRKLSYVATILFTVGSLIYGNLPSFVDLWPHSAYHTMIFSRVTVGFSSGLYVICRTYLASSTTIRERTTAYSIMSASQSLGFVLGPIIQMVMTLLIDDDMMKYQATGYISAIMGFLNFVAEYDIAAKERKKIEEQSSDRNPVKLKPDVPALIALVTMFFIGSLNYILLETLLEPLVQDQYAWCDYLAVIVVGVFLTATGGIFLVMYLLVPFLAKLFDERKMLIIGGAGISIIGLLLLQPIGSTPLKYCSQQEVNIYKYFGNHSSSEFIDQIITFSNKFPDFPNFQRDNSTFEHHLFEGYCKENNECLGCPPHQTWCLNVSQLPLSQVIIGFSIVLSMWPINLTIAISLYSKMLGNLPQGMWLGFFSATGSFARMVGPVYVSYIYSYLGPQYTFAILTILMFIGGFFTFHFYDRIVPLTTKAVSNKK